MRFSFRMYPDEPHDLFTDTAAASLVGQETTVNLPSGPIPGVVRDAEFDPAEPEFIVVTVEIDPPTG